MGKLMGLILIVALAYAAWQLQGGGSDGATAGMSASSETARARSDEPAHARKSRVSQMGQVGPLE